MNSTSPRTLTRSTTDRKISGISGGLGEYLGIDPVLVVKERIPDHQPEILAW